MVGMQTQPQPPYLMKKALLIAASIFLYGSAALAVCPPGQSEVIVSISTDRYGDETTWILTGPGGTPVYASGGPYTLQSASGSYPQTPVAVCITDGNAVVFTINDEYGDGLCCSYGNGTYSVTMNGTTVVSYASFQSSRQVLFQAGAPASMDLAMYTVNMPAMMGAGNVSISGTVKNFGTTPVSSFILNYSVDNGTVQTQTISANIAANGQYNFTHPTPWIATSGEHVIQVWVGLADGTPDGYPNNDSLTTNVSVASQSVTRTSVMEEFTSSTCWPCAQVNATFDPLLANMNANQDGSHLAAVKYQMNWPAPGTDPSYNADGNTRKSYYGVNGIPYPMVDGNSISPTSSALTTAMAKPSFVTMDVSYTLVGTDITVSANVTPRFSGSGYKLYLVVTEDYYHYPDAYTSQKDYHFAMRKILPNGGGITLSSLVADEQQTIERSYTLIEGGAAKNNFNLWGTVDGLTVVAFVQNIATKEILQAAFATQAVVGIKDNVANDLLRIWPNPTSDQIYLRYGRPLSSDATVEVFNALGERVLITKRNFSSKDNMEMINLEGLGQGIYLVRLIADGISSTQRITLSR